jgi:N-acetyl-anhydromuramyl-L-alanine amidase AmpD
MNIVTTVRSPNFTDLDIPVEFVVLHFTAATLDRTLEIFTDPGSEVSAHLVIDRDGSIYEVVPCLGGAARRAWHAGKSRMEISTNGDSQLIESFNDRSIGIELVNLNGNLFPYTEAQYASLFGVIERLKSLYPALGRPEVIVGHEQISGFRGKSDPGLCFEWERLFAVCYPNLGAPRRAPVCRKPFAEKMATLVRGLGISVDRQTGDILVPKGVDGAFFEHLSALSESALSRDEV